MFNKLKKFKINRYHLAASLLLILANSTILQANPVTFSIAQHKFIAVSPIGRILSLLKLTQLKKLAQSQADIYCSQIAIPKFQHALSWEAKVAVYGFTFNGQKVEAISIPTDNGKSQTIYPYILDQVTCDNPINKRPTDDVKAILDQFDKVKKSIETRSENTNENCCQGGVCTIPKAEPKPEPKPPGPPKPEKSLQDNATEWFTKTFLQGREPYNPEKMKPEELVKIYEKFNTYLNYLQGKANRSYEQYERITQKLLNDPQNQANWTINGKEAVKKFMAIVKEDTRNRESAMNGSHLFNMELLDNGQVARSVDKAVKNSNKVSAFTAILARLDETTDWDSFLKKNPRFYQDKSLKAFDRETVLVPFLHHGHFTLAVVKKNEKKITVYDSLKGTAPKTDQYRKIIELIEKIPNRQQIPFTDWKIEFGESPQQNNVSDCGIFTILTAEKLARGESISKDSYKMKDVPYKRARLFYEAIENAYKNPNLDSDDSIEYEMTLKLTKP